MHIKGADHPVLVLNSCNGSRAKGMTQHREGYRQPGNRDERLPFASICHREKAKEWLGRAV